MINRHQSRTETHQTLDIIIVIIVEELHHHEGIQRYVQSSQVLNCSKLCTVGFNSREKLAALGDSVGYISRSLFWLLCLGQSPAIAIRQAYILHKTIRNLKLCIRDKHVTVLYTFWHRKLLSLYSVLKEIKITVSCCKGCQESVQHSDFQNDHIIILWSWKAVWQCHSRNRALIIAVLPPS
jgi:hypothetical protein